MDSIWGVVLVGVLIALNGLFVAAEFALVALSRGAIEERAEAGERRARLVLRQLKDVSFVLSGAQLGITATSLVVGFLAEASIAGLLEPVFGSFSEDVSLGVSLALAFALSTLFQMVLGELFPKNLAIARPEAVAVAVAPVVRIYLLVLGPVIRLFDMTAAGLTRMLGASPPVELLAGHSSDDLARIIAASGEVGSLEPDQTDLLLRAVTLGARRATEVMVPRRDIVWLEASDAPEVIRIRSRETGHSRFPVRGASDDDVIGAVHIKDLLSPIATTARTVGDLATPVPFVPESYRLRRLLGDLSSRTWSLAVVVDEFGDTAGMVTLENVLEALVGDIVDEHDRPIVEVVRVAGGFEIPGSLRARRLAKLIHAELPSGDFETAAGLVIEVAGRLPDINDEVTVSGWAIQVLELEGPRIVKLGLSRRGGS